MDAAHCCELIATGYCPGATIISALVASSPSTSATRREFPDAAQRALQRGLQDELVAGQHRPAEARLVDADEVQLPVLVRIHARGDEREDARGLRQRLEDDHARQHRPVREMSGKERLVDRHVLERADRLARKCIPARGPPAGRDSDAAAGASLPECPSSTLQSSPCPHSSSFWSCSRLRRASPLSRRTCRASSSSRWKRAAFLRNRGVSSTGMPLE